MDEIRTFVAVEMDHAILEALARVQQHLRQAGAEVSWVRPEAMHLTLKFLGNVAPSVLPELQQALAGVTARHAPFHLSVAGMGGFPNLRKPRVVWAGIQEGAAAFVALAQDIERALALLGFPPERHDATPHLTLGRVKSPAGLEALLPLVQEHAGDNFGEMTATACVLFRSELFPQGARYTALQQHPLCGADGGVPSF